MGSGASKSQQRVQPSELEVKNESISSLNGGTSTNTTTGRPTLKLPTVGESDILTTFSRQTELTKEVERRSSALKGQIRHGKIIVCAANYELRLVDKLTNVLEDHGILLHGADRAADASKERLEGIAKASIYLAVIGPTFEKDKKCKIEFQHAVKRTVPVFLLFAGPLGFRPSCKWITQHIMESRENVLDYQIQSEFKENAKLLALLLESQQYPHKGPKNGSALPTADSAIRSLTNSKDSVKSLQALESIVSVALTNPEQLLTNGRMQLIADKMKRNSKNVDLVLLGCYAILHLLASSKAVCQNFQESVGIVFLWDVMRTMSYNADVICCCLRSLQFMANCGYIHIDSGDQFLELMSRYFGHAEIQFNGVQLLHSTLVGIKADQNHFDISKVESYLKAISEKYPSSTLTDRKSVV